MLQRQAEIALYETSHLRPGSQSGDYIAPMERSTTSRAERIRARIGPGGGRGRLVAAVAAATLLVDLATKLVAVAVLSGEGPTEILGGAVELQLYRNFAGPNNIFPGHTELLSIFSIVVAAALVYVAFRVRSRLAAVGVGLLLGGAAGNLVDRLFREPEPLRGGVIDWFSLFDVTKMMNIADVAIHVGIVVLIVAMLLDSRAGEDAPRAGRAPADGSAG